MDIRKELYIMLITFNFENYRSFKNESSLDMTATQIRENSEHIIKLGHERILPVASIYGANASGKSNVYEAFKCMNQFVVESAHYADHKEEYLKHLPEPYAFDLQRKKEDTSFEVYLIIDNDPKERIYNYGFSLNEAGISEEWLNVKSKTASAYKRIFLRSLNHLEMPGFDERTKENIQTVLDQYSLIISTGALLKIEICKNIRNWFMKNQFTNFSNQIKSELLEHLLPTDFVHNETVRKKVVSYIHAFDPSIQDFKVEKMPTINHESYYLVYALHKLNNSGELISIPLYKESSGTIKMFLIYQKLKDVLDHGGVYFFDDLDTHLHPLVMRTIVQAFLNTQLNKFNAQLIFSNHDLIMMTNDILRRDEIYFVDKDKDECSLLYSFTDIVNNHGNIIRKDENFVKNYLLGKYRAIPKLTGLNSLKQ